MVRGELTTPHALPQSLVKSFEVTDLPGAALQPFLTPAARPVGQHWPKDTSLATMFATSKFLLFVMMTRAYAGNRFLKRKCFWAFFPGRKSAACISWPTCVRMGPCCAVRTAKFVARKQWVVCGSDDMYVRVFNYNTMDKVKQFEAHTDYIRCATAPQVLQCHRRAGTVGCQWRIGIVFRVHDLRCDTGAQWHALAGARRVC